MTKPAIAYHASHEQFSPSHLLKLVVLAEAAGFQAINCSDHFHPWSERQGQSGHSFSWLGAAMQSTDLPFSMVCAPGQRYHPAIVAQAIATLSEMFPGRLTVALGSGEAINESVTGEPWPGKSHRNERLQQCYEVIKDLLKGNIVNYARHINIKDAKLYTLPVRPPLLIGAALTAETAGWMGKWADGLMTVNKPLEELKKVINAFRENGGAGKPIYLKVQLSYARTEDDALNDAYQQWRTNVLPSYILSDIDNIAEFERLAERVTNDDLHKAINISADPQYHIDMIRQYSTLGFDTIVLHNVGRDQELFINVFGEKVLPALKCNHGN